MLQVTDGNAPKDKPLQSLGGELETGLQKSVAHPPLRRVYAARDFYATSADQLSIFVDDGHLELLSEDSGRPGWWCLRDAASGQGGLVPCDAIEEAWEREARVNCSKNNQLDARNDQATRKLAKKTTTTATTSKQRVGFSKAKPEQIPVADYPGPVGAGHIASREPRWAEYDPALESHLKRLLEDGLDRRPGQLVRVYPGISMGPIHDQSITNNVNDNDNNSSIHKTVRVNEDMTIGEMTLSAGLRWSRGTGKERHALFLRHMTTFRVLRLEPKWRLGQVIELAKAISFQTPDASLANLPRAVRRHYRKAARLIGDGNGGLDALKRRPDLDFCTRFQFVIERQ